MKEDRRKLTVAIVGASEKPERYSHKAQAMLMAEGYEVIPISARGKAILGIEGLSSLAEYHGEIDTVTLYIGPQRLAGMLGSILAKKPRRVIFNPGTESMEHEGILAAADILVENTCTLVLLQTGQF